MTIIISAASAITTATATAVDTRKLPFSLDKIDTLEYLNQTFPFNVSVKYIMLPNIVKIFGESSW